MYIFTSGTTGLPKAAHISHGRWLMAGDVMSISMDITPDDVSTVSCRCTHGAAAMSAGSTALAGGARIVVRRKFSRSEFWADVRRYHITVCQYVGEICRFLLSAPPTPEDKNQPAQTFGHGHGARGVDPMDRALGDQFQIA